MIPYKVNPFGITKDKGYFELVIKPGIFDARMSFSFIASRRTANDFCHVIDWGDGTGQNEPSSGAYYTHTYSVAGTYTIKILAHVWNFNIPMNGTYNSSMLVYDCNGNWDALGGTYLTQTTSCFYGANQATFESLKTLPLAVQKSNYMFYNCLQARFSFQKELPDSIENMESMFHNCRLSTLNFSRWPKNVQRINDAFGGCFNSLCSFNNLPSSLTYDGINSVFDNNMRANFTITELPEGITTANNAFSNCYNADITLHRLPSTLQSAINMFYSNVAAKIDISELARNAPPGGYALTNITNMFYSCYNVTGSRSEFLAACPNVTTTTGAFNNTNTTE